MDMSFYKGKKILITGHTGFKGSWLCRILVAAGAKVTGYALAPDAVPNHFDLSGVSADIHSVIGDIRDRDTLIAAFVAARPEIVFHMAAQPLVKAGYDAPAYTYETNVMGTVNILECLRTSDCVRSFVNVTTDKVYKNFEWARGYRENDVLDGYDPYSNSKSCSELVTHSYTQSFLAERGVAVSTARAGNVIGGGDFAADRIVPDCVRAAQKKEEIGVRSPESIRPFQHVLEPLFAYLLIARRQYDDIALADCYNVGPDDIDCVTTKTLVTLFCDAWGESLAWVDTSPYAHHEAAFLKLDNTKIKQALDWAPKWHIDTAIRQSVAWYKAYVNKGDYNAVMARQIQEYLQEETR